MTHDEFKRWLAKQGAHFDEGKRHTKVFLNDKASVLPRHGKKEIAVGTLNAIKRQLGLKEDR
jgi:mRNA interferase HicA